MIVRFATVALLLTFVAEVMPQPAQAQRPFRTHEPFYRDESARRAFFDAFAVTGELSYRSPGTLGNTVTPGNAVVPNPVGGLAMVFNLDYQLAPQLDFSAILDASGSLSGQSITLSWLALKRYWHADGTDYALRFAFDPRPAPKTGFGFRQIDLAGVVTTLLSRRVSMDIIGGTRRANIGIERLLLTGGGIDQAFEVETKVPGPDLVFNQARGQEVHLMVRYNVHFDPARSHLFTSVLYEAGDYEITEQLVSQIGIGRATQETHSFRGQVVWLRIGISWHRPSYRVAPFISLPLQTWERPDAYLLDAQGPQRANFGLRITLR